MWHFADGSCYPQAAEVNGQQTNGNEAGGDLCVLANLPSGCQDPGPWLGANTQGTDFPTYFTAKYCSGDNTWRISYNIYFRHVSKMHPQQQFLIFVLLMLMECRILAMRVIGSSWSLSCNKIPEMETGSATRLFSSRTALRHTLTGVIWILLTSRPLSIIHSRSLSANDD